MKGWIKLFKLEEKQEIGNYLKKLIDENYESQASFCKAYLEADNREFDELQNMANRLSQIIKGAKAIQTYDLPIFTKLLNVTCEEILSAGKSFVPDSKRMTNYNIAFASDPNVWEDYINRDEQLILNSDEYGKTVIDYALEFKNYEFLKYLMDKKYIWFVDTKDEYLGVSCFRAGTKINRKLPASRTEPCASLERELSENILLRILMISLAIENNDYEILDELRARETDALYSLNVYNERNYEKYYQEYNDDMIVNISTASEQILDYFSEEFVIIDCHNQKHTFIYPFMGKLIDLLIKNNNVYLEKVLKSVIKHNQSVYHDLMILVTETINDGVEEQKKYLKYSRYLNGEIEKYFNGEMTRDSIDGIVKDRIDSIIDAETERTLEHISFTDDGIVCFYNNTMKKQIISNVICANEWSKDSRVNSLIQELNNSYNKIRDFKSENIKLGD